MAEKDGVTMKKLKWIGIIVGILVLIVGLTVGLSLLTMYNAEYGFDHTVPPDEAINRSQMVHAAEGFLGCNEADGSHKEIIDIYNAHEPLAQGYQVTYEDKWCATFVSAVAIECGFTDVIPTECSCQRQIELFQKLGVWEEADDYLPLPGDIIYYRIDGAQLTGDCTAYADHVGIVVGTNGNFIKVIEGNKNDEVAYRYLSVNDSIIRGYAIPDYGSAG